MALDGVGPYWEQFWSTQVPSQLAPKSVERVPIGSNRSYWLKAGLVCMCVPFPWCLKIPVTLQKERKS